MAKVDSIRQFLLNVQQDYAELAVRKDLVASGKTIRSIKVVRNTLIGNDLTWIEQGRGPGGMPPIQEIAKWVRVRALDMNPWAVAKSIALRGTRIYRNPGLGISIASVIDKNIKSLGRDIAQDYRDRLLEAVRAFNYLK